MNKIIDISIIGMIAIPLPKPCTLLNHIHIIITGKPPLANAHRSLFLLIILFEGLGECLQSVWNPPAFVL